MWNAESEGQSHIQTLWHAFNHRATGLWISQGHQTISMIQSTFSFGSLHSFQMLVLFPHGNSHKTAYLQAKLTSQSWFRHTEDTSLICVWPFGLCGAWMTFLTSDRPLIPIWLSHVFFFVPRPSLRWINPVLFGIGRLLGTWGCSRGEVTSASILIWEFLCSPLQPSVLGAQHNLCSWGWEGHRSKGPVFPYYSWGPSSVWTY